MAELPNGTVTFLLTDVEGSTVLWEQYPEAMQVALARHDALLGTGIERHGGTVIKARGEGDSFFAVFSRASYAAAAAADLQRQLNLEAWATPRPVRVRMALHTGEAQLRGGDYYGRAVNRCARLRAAGHGGQVLLSQSTYDLIRDAPPAGCILVDLGEHHLVDLTRPERVFQLTYPSSPTAFPPLRTLNARSDNLPVQRDPLIGRDREVAAVRELILRGDVGLVTLTGPGGTGKTRLALRAANEVKNQFADGVYFVELAAISDSDLVPATIGHTLGIRDAGSQPVLESLKHFLREKETLLVVDNFEQLLPAAPALSALLAAGQRLKILVTSRAALRVRGEFEFAVPPLSLPDTNGALTAEGLSQFGAVALFIARAIAVRSDFAVTNENARAVASICHRLDGLPLAIELATARLRLLPPEALLGRLNRRLPLLTGGPRDLPARQQTLRSTIAWSHDLLSQADKVVFRRLSVFAGGCSLVAAETICGNDALDGLDSLADQSLLQQHDQAQDDPRFAMLETIREYALEQLEESGEAESIRRQHADFFLTFAEDAESRLLGADRAPWLERLGSEHDNMRAALRWAGQSQLAEYELRLAGALGWFWYFRGHLGEGREWLSQALSRPTASGFVSARAKALAGAARLARYQDDRAAARSLAEQSVRLWREIGDNQGLANALNVLGLTAWAQGDADGARHFYEESGALCQQMGDRWGYGQSRAYLGSIAALRPGEESVAHSALEESEAIFRELGDGWSLGQALLYLGIVNRREGNDASARSLFEHCVPLFNGAGDKFRLALALLNLGDVVWLGDDCTAARGLFMRSLALFGELGNRRMVAECLAGLAGVSGAMGNAERAARLCGAVEGLLNVSTMTAVRGDNAASESDIPRWQTREHALPGNWVNRVEYGRQLARARSHLAEETFGAARAGGQAMTLDQVLAYALET